MGKKENKLKDTQVFYYGFQYHMRALALILASVNHFNLERAKDIANWGAEVNINKGEMIKSLIPLYKKWTGNCHTLSTGKRRGKLWGNTIPNSKNYF